MYLAVEHVDMGCGLFGCNVRGRTVRVRVAVRVVVRVAVRVAVRVRDVVRTCVELRLRT